MIKKLLVGIGIMSMGILPCLSFAQSVQEFTQELLGLQLGDSYEHISQTHRLVADKTQPQESPNQMYSMMLEVPEIDGTPLYKMATLIFYNNQLASISVSYLNREDVIVQLRSNLIKHLGKPTNIDTVDMSVSSNEKDVLTSYVWTNGDMRAVFDTTSLSEVQNNLILFSYIPLEEKNMEEQDMEYAHLLKENTGSKAAFEEMIRKNSSYKEEIKKKMEKNPEYAAALRDSGVDMSIFD